MHLRRTLILISTTISAACSCLIFPAAGLAGNAAPKLYLEVWDFEGGVPDPVPTDVCIHTTAPTGGIHCHDQKLAYHTAAVALHVGNLDTPTCPTIGPACATYGGYVGVGFGIVTSGEAVVFLGWTACPGFLAGPSFAGEPAACLATSAWGCREWWEHLGYLTYVNMSTATGATYFDIVASADDATYDVINCANSYDTNTSIGGGAQWGGTQTVTCSSTPVGETTWGKIKSLFR